MTIFTNNIANGLSLSILSYVLLKAAVGKWREIHVSLYGLSIFLFTISLPWPDICYLFNCERNLIHFSLHIVQLFLSYNNAHRDAQKSIKSYFALYDPGYLCETGFLISSRDTACEL